MSGKTKKERLGEGRAINNPYAYISQLFTLGDTVYQQPLAGATISSFYIVFPSGFHWNAQVSEESGSFPEQDKCSPSSTPDEKPRSGPSYINTCTVCDLSEKMQKKKKNPNQKQLRLR